MTVEGERGAGWVVRLLGGGQLVEDGKQGDRAQMSGEEQGVKAKGWNASATIGF